MQEGLCPRLERECVSPRSDQAWALSSLAFGDCLGPTPTFRASLSVAELPSPLRSSLQAGLAFGPAVSHSLGALCRPVVKC